MNREFTRMQKLAGILTEGYQGTDYESSEDMALDMVKTGAGMPGTGLPEGRSKMTKSEAKMRIKEAILGEMNYLDEAKKKKMVEDEEEEDVDMDIDLEDGEVDAPVDSASIDMDMNDTPDMSVDSADARETFDDLAKAYQAAKGLGDEKLIQQLANTITYFNKNIILK